MALQEDLSILETTSSRSLVKENSGSIVDGIFMVSETAIESSLSTFLHQIEFESKIEVSSIIPELENVEIINELFDIHDIFSDGSDVVTWRLDGSTIDLGGSYNGSASNITWDNRGQFGGAAYFGTSTSWITAPYSVSNNTFTLSFWAIIDEADTSLYGTWLFRQQTYTGNLDVRLSTTDTPVIELGFYDNSVVLHHVSVPFEFGVLANYMLEFDKATATIRAYKNGELVDSKSSVSMRTNYSNQSFIIGTSNEGTATYYQTDKFMGSMSQIRMFNRLLTPEEKLEVVSEERVTVSTKIPISLTMNDFVGVDNSTDSVIETMVANSFNDTLGIVCPFPTIDTVSWSGDMLGEAHNLTITTTVPVSDLRITLSDPRYTTDTNVNTGGLFVISTPTVVDPPAGYTETLTIEVQMTSLDGITKIETIQQTFVTVLPMELFTVYFHTHMNDLYLPENNGCEYMWITAPDPDRTDRVIKYCWHTKVTANVSYYPLVWSDYLSLNEPIFDLQSYHYTLAGDRADFELMFYDADYNYLGRFFYQKWSSTWSTGNYTHMDFYDAQDNPIVSLGANNFAGTSYGNGAMRGTFDFSNPSQIYVKPISYTSSTAWQSVDRYWNVAHPFSTMKYVKIKVNKILTTYSSGGGGTIRLLQKNDLFGVR